MLYGFSEKLFKSVGDLVGTVGIDAYGDRVAVAHAEPHYGKELLEIDASIAKGQGDLAPQLLRSLDKQTRRTGVQTVGIGDGIRKASFHCFFVSFRW